MEISNDLAYQLLKKFVQLHLNCSDLSIGTITNLPIVKPNDKLRSEYGKIIGTPLLLINKSTYSLDFLRKKTNDESYWINVLKLCLGNRISWYDSFEFGKTAMMPKTIEELQIMCDLAA